MSDKIKNPYKNTANILVKEKGVRNMQEFLNQKIKDYQLNITLGEMLEFARYHAFEEGRELGNYEKSMEIKNALDVEKPLFINQIENVE